MAKKKNPKEICKGCRFLWVKDGVTCKIRESFGKLRWERVASRVCHLLRSTRCPGDPRKSAKSRTTGWAVSARSRAQAPGTPVLVRESFLLVNVFTGLATEGPAHVPRPRHATGPDHLHGALLSYSHSKLERIYLTSMFLACFLIFQTFRKHFSEMFNNFRCEISGNFRI